jgi:hypothetical protein
LSFSALASVGGLCHAVQMKTKNKKELEKYWAEKAKKASKPTNQKPPQKKTTSENANQAAAEIVKEATKD